MKTVRLARPNFAEFQSKPYERNSSVIRVAFGVESGSVIRYPACAWDACFSARRCRHLPELYLPDTVAILSILFPHTRCIRFLPVQGYYRIPNASGWNESSELGFVSSGRADMTPFYWTINPERVERLGPKDRRSKM